MAVTQSPWELAGECVIAVARRPGAGLGPLPMGCQTAPGLVRIVAASFEGSPVGPYLEFAVAEPVRTGFRVKPCITTIVVDSAASRLAGRLNWGFPKELGRLMWTSEGDQRALRWDERDIELRAVGGGPRFPVVVPVRVRQRRGDELVLVPGRLRGWGRLANVEMTTPVDDPLNPLSGRHRGLLVAGARLVMGTACTRRVPNSTLRALRAAPEPALSLAPNRGD